MKTKKSINGKYDIFGNGSPFNDDHIWPTSKGGSNIKENILRLSKESNEKKGDKTAGFINDIRFAISKKTTKKNDEGMQHVYGEMQVLIDGKWFKVVNG